MADVKIDDELYKEVVSLIKQGEIRFEFPSAKAFIDKAVLKMLKSIKEKAEKNNKKKEKQ